MRRANFTAGRNLRALAALTLAVLSAASLTACSTPDRSSTQVTVVQQADACTFDSTELSAGLIKFVVSNKSESTNEFYLLAADKTTVLGEIESVGASTQRTLLKTLEAGDYFGRCKTAAGKTIAYVPFTVTGTLDASLDETAEERAVSASYQTWVNEQAAALLSKTEAFSAAVKAGDTTLAKALYAKARWHWEAIEPIAESFGDLDPILDARDGDLEPGTPWTGWHALEQQLWVSGLRANASELADGLVTNTKELVARIPKIKLLVLDMANGAKGLLDEVATTKITGEEERYSRTDLVDFAANVFGARKVVELASPLLSSDDDSAYLQDLLARFDELEAALLKHALSDSTGITGFVPFVSYDALDKDQISELAFLVEGVSEPLAHLATKLTGKQG